MFKEVTYITQITNLAMEESKPECSYVDLTGYKACTILLYTILYTIYIIYYFTEIKSVLFYYYSNYILL